jgi:hypothetical protein
MCPGEPPNHRHTEVGVLRHLDLLQQLDDRQCCFLEVLLTHRVGFDSIRRNYGEQVWPWLGIA